MSSMDWEIALPTPSEAERAKNVKLEQLRIQLQTAVARDEALQGALFRRAQQPPAVFVPDGTIQLLPEGCEIRLDTDSQVPFGGQVLQLQPFERELPQWNPLQMPTRLVGKVKASFTAAQYRNPGRRVEQFACPQQTSSQSQAAESAPVIFLVVDPPTPTAGRDVFLHPKAIAPFYYLVTEDIVIDIDDVELTEDANEEIKRLEILATLLEDWDTALSLQFSTFALQARNWRRERREWELETVQTIFLSGNLDMLAPTFGISDLVNTRQFVDMENKLDQLGEVEPWEKVWNEEACAAAQVHNHHVKHTMYKVKRILFDLIPASERHLERNRDLVLEMGVYARFLAKLAREGC
jgi:hypothetical protein